MTSEIVAFRSAKVRLGCSSERSTTTKATFAERKATLALASLCLLLPLVSTHPAIAQADRAVVREYAQRQERAKALTERLISRLIDLHLQRMRDNGLTDLPLYEELSSMRDRVDEIAGRHMPRVQEMLAAAAVADDTQRKQLLIDAQREMQAILR
ncbi:MAG: hypothetical protein GY711_18285, partial [bacterium]|nr:hypothetical protein [bacterium]